jgi:hypothetical protein
LLQYEECSRILDVELGVRPMDETTALFREIRRDPVIVPEMDVGPSSAHTLAPMVRDAATARSNYGVAGPVADSSSRVQRLLATVDDAIESLRGLRINLEESRLQLRQLAKVAGTGEVSTLVDASRSHELPRQPVSRADSP